MKLYERGYDEYEDYPIGDEDGIYAAGASAYDCTGLIPRAPENEDEAESYEDIYPFRPQGY